MSNNFRSIIVAPSARFKDFINPGFYEGCRIVSLLKNKSNLSDFWEKTAKLFATLNQLSGGESQLANTYDEKLKCIGAADYYFFSENETTQDWDEETMNFLYKLSEQQKYDQIISYNVLCEAKNKGLDLGLKRQSTSSCIRRWSWDEEPDTDDEKYKRKVHCWILNDVQDGSGILVIDCYNPAGSTYNLSDFTAAFAERMSILFEAHSENKGLQVFRDAYKNAIDDILKKSVLTK